MHRAELNVSAVTVRVLYRDKIINKTVPWRKGINCLAVFKYIFFAVLLWKSRYVCIKDDVRQTFDEPMNFIQCKEQSIIKWISKQVCRSYKAYSSRYEICLCLDLKEQFITSIEYIKYLNFIQILVVNAKKNISVLTNS